MKGIKNVCQLLGRCDGHWGDVRRLLGSVAVLRGVSSLRKVCQLMERCDGHGGM